MSFTEWLYAELLGEGVIDEETGLEELSTEVLLSDTDLEEADIENYRAQFKEHCESINLIADFDLDE